MTQLYLVRHGQTDWNLEGRYTGQADIPLNDTGRQQAQAAATQLDLAQVAAVYCSDLIRARQTAEVLVESSGLQIHNDARLREIDQGEWEGLHFQDIKARFAERFARRNANPLEVAPPGGETVGQVRGRVLAALEDIVAQHPEEGVLIVSHGLALAIIRAEVGGIPIEQVWELIPSNAEVEHIELQPGTVRSS